MAPPDFSKKTDAELARFCAVKSDALTRMRTKIGTAGNPSPDLLTAFDEAAALLSAAADELKSRLDKPQRTKT